MVLEVAIVAIVVLVIVVVVAAAAVVVIINPFPHRLTSDLPPHNVGGEGRPPWGVDPQHHCLDGGVTLGLPDELGQRLRAHSLSVGEIEVVVVVVMVVVEVVVEVMVEVVVEVVVAVVVVVILVVPTMLVVATAEVVIVGKNTGK